MQSSLLFHVTLSLPSSAVILGTTEGELYHYYQNTPPDTLNLYEIDVIQKQKLKSGSYDSMWFESAAAQKEPLLIDTLDILTGKLVKSLLIPASEVLAVTEVIDCFKFNMPKNLNLGGALECLRIINHKYGILTGQLSDFLDRLSAQEFFRLA
jgi:hypothetical protein